VRSSAGGFELGLGGFSLLEADQLLDEGQTAAAGGARVTPERNLVDVAGSFLNALPDGSIADAIAVTDEHRLARET